MSRAGFASLALVAGLGFAGPAAAETAPVDEIKAGRSLAGNYLAARIATTDRDTAAAVEFYRKAIALDPDNTDLKLQGFMNFIANGDFAEGVELGDEIVKAGDAPEIVRLILSVEALRKKSWKQAERLLESEWRSPVDRLIAGLVDGWVEFGRGNAEKALEAVDELSGPGWFNFFVEYHGGLIALAAGDVPAAVGRLEKATANPAGRQFARRSHMRSVAALAQAHFRNKNKDAATAILTSALQDNPQDPLYESMLQAAKDGRTPGFELNTAQRGGAEVFLNLGMAVDREGGEQFALIYVQLARVLSAQNDDIALKLAELLDKQSRLKEANALFSKIDPNSHNYRIARLEYALNLDELDQKDVARKELDALLESGPDDLVAHLSYGAVMARHEKYDESIKIYNRYIAQLEQPQRVHWNLFYRLGIAYERTKQWSLAEAAFKRALELEPDQPSVLNYLGYSWIDMDINLQEGLDMIRKAVSLRPNDGYMVDSLGWAFYRLGRIPEAVKELERAVELRPGDPTINDHLGDAYWLANRKLEATFQWQHALALDPPDGTEVRIADKLKNGLDAVLEKEKAAKLAEEQK
ncbi:TPR repeat-containing protein [Ahrensia sp. R2A130]|nr:TPR repeat-containing protein [Ahrensia sp. R2A130]